MSRAVWVLERWISKEEMQHLLTYIQALKAPNARLLEQIEEGLRKHPNGYWCGAVGSCNYEDFVLNAKNYISGSPENPKLRVVRADIDNGAQYWVGYHDPVEHSEVLRYLYTQTA